ncbi:hypothetical protein [Methylomonas koyamae]|uniref:Uncharacterized protein n=1 Tax=Methylomonas koyamae TaxID=702114 RepID=A0A291IMI8_9GAMM|nr:hypothetical protein [Methylomonas koyamae]ATG91489.1 hypothetical protein MKLM6_3299 [Methylomonas koyamae]OAI26877.1 hypothetical protein A1356_10725 [Methylomonas koyamae]
MNFYKLTSGKLAAVAIGLCCAGPAAADANYYAGAELAYAIAILDSDNPSPDSRTGLSIVASYRQPTDAASFYAALSGDGQYQTSGPNPAQTPIADAYLASFATAGASAVSGSIDSFQIGWFELAFANAGPYSYKLNVTLDYTLHALAHGAYAEAMLYFDYWDDAGIGSSQDLALASAFPGQADDGQNVPGSAYWQLLLAPGATVNLYAQAGILSHLDTAAFAPVPLPSAGWLFAAHVAGWLRRRAKSSRGKLMPA